MNLTDILSSLVGGGIGGITIAYVLAKFLVKNQLEKSLKQYQHNLDIQKHTTRQKN